MFKKFKCLGIILMLAFFIGVKPTINSITIEKSPLSCLWSSCCRQIRTVHSKKIEEILDVGNLKPFYGVDLEIRRDKETDHLVIIFTRGVLRDDENIFPGADVLAPWKVLGEEEFSFALALDKEIKGIKVYTGIKHIKEVYVLDMPFSIDEYELGVEFLYDSIRV